MNKICLMHGAIPTNKILFVWGDSHWIQLFLFIGDDSRRIKNFIRRKSSPKNKNHFIRQEWSPTNKTFFIRRDSRRITTTLIILLTNYKLFYFYEHHDNIADVTLAAGRLSDSIQALTDDVRHPQQHQSIFLPSHNHQNLDAFWPWSASICKHKWFNIPRTRTKFRDYSLWQVHENGMLCQPQSETQLKHLCSNVSSKLTFQLGIFWHITYGYLYVCL